jgi:hypothetical protein
MVSRDLPARTLGSRSPATDGAAQPGRAVQGMLTESKQAVEDPLTSSTTVWSDYEDEVV